MIGGNGFGGRHFTQAFILGPLTTRCETTTDKIVSRFWWRAGYGHQTLLFAVQTRAAIDQCARIGVGGAVENFPHRRALHNIAGVHDTNTVAHFCHYTKIMRDDNQAHAQIALHVLQHL